jgi:hypothetical protein
VLAGQHGGDLAHGAALACAARTHAGLIPAHTAAAAHALTGALAEEASGWVASGLGRIGQSAAGPGGYQAWRQEICGLWAAFRAPGDMQGTLAGAGRAGGVDDDTADLAAWDVTADDPYVPAPRAGTAAPVPARGMTAAALPGGGQPGKPER